ncbi:MAG: putative Peptidase, family [Nitrospira sp.]|jgi:hypothetical protein|nr:putative Peptidase, family [Nitrospira sp.]
MSTVWTAHYFDGRTATRHRVTITVTPAALHLLTCAGEIKQWPYEQIRPTQDRYNGEAVRLEFGPEPAEFVLISTPALLDEIYKTAPAMAQHLHKPSRRSERVRAGFFAALAVAFPAFGLYRWGDPGHGGRDHALRAFRLWYNPPTSRPSLCAF